MPTHPHLQIVSDRVVEPTPDAPAKVVLYGPTLGGNEWLATSLESRGYQVDRQSSMTTLATIMARDESSIALFESSVAQRAEALDLVRGLDPRSRRRLLLLASRPAWRAVRQFIDAGVPDFLKLPASLTELAFRLELRARDVRSLPPTEVLAPRVQLPQVNPLEGSIGPPSGSVRLSERELLVYGMLAEQPGMPVRRTEILARIWGRGAGTNPSSNIVDVYINYLRAKLARLAPPLSIKTIRGVGYLLEAQSEARLSVD